MLRRFLEARLTPSCTASAKLFGEVPTTSVILYVPGIRNSFKSGGCQQCSPPKAGVDFTAATGSFRSRDEGFCRAAQKVAAATRPRQHESGRGKPRPPVRIESRARPAYTAARAVGRPLGLPLA